jgi:NAD(P)-dependent dehydrogenase (short-subunit alcohol dehydrogenase family)
MSNENSTKVAIITGASQGIGAGLVEAYRKLGYAVVANSRNITPSSDPLVLAVPGDISDPAVGQRLVDQAIATWGRVDTVINNAGIFTAKPFTDYTPEEYAQNIGINVNGFFNVTQPALKVMQRGGHVVTISTNFAENPDRRVPSFTAALTKGGLNAASQSLAIEYAEAGIRPRDPRVPLGAAPGRPHGRDLGHHRRRDLPGDRQVRHRRDPARRRWHHRR